MKNLELQSNHPSQPLLTLQTTQISTSLKYILHNQSYTFCAGKNKGFFACINNQCSSNRPFICLTSTCKCYDIHKLCSQKRIDALHHSLQNIFLQSNSKQQLIRNKFQALNDRISNFSDKLIDKLKPCEDKKPSNSHTNIQLKEVMFLRDSLKEKSLTGNMISKMFSASKLKAQDKEHEEIMSWLGRQFKDFEENNLKKFLQFIQKMLIPSRNRQKVTFSQTMKHRSLQSEKKTKIVSYSSIKGMMQMALLDPQFNESI